MLSSCVTTSFLCGSAISGPCSLILALADAAFSVDAVISRRAAPRCRDDSSALGPRHPPSYVACFDRHASCRCADRRRIRSRTSIRSRLADGRHRPIAGVTGQLADATGDFACLVFVFLVASARPRVVQSATCPVHEMSSPRVGNPRVGVSASCPVTIASRKKMKISHRQRGPLRGIFRSHGSKCVRLVVK